MFMAKSFADVTPATVDADAARSNGLGGVTRSRKLGPESSALFVLSGPGSDNDTRFDMDASTLPSLRLSAGSGFCCVGRAYSRA
jgi:hypothetical protein